ncbi:MAG TPA: alpha/beta hydrolase family protein [Solirubrobacteraceae bacterium]|jgi:S-formylglutathione hydrolase FrmB|nr:alpha/beta hydrolase family protein [Solirubrobacteraceae bacterium]
MNRPAPPPHLRLAGILLLAALAVAPAVAPAARAAQPTLDGPGALTLVSTQQLDPRLSELTFSTPALTGPTSVRVLVPADYSSSNRRYPALYLLNGAFGDETDWTVQGDAEALTAGLPVIVVMPDGGASGFYTDWSNFGGGGPPEYETYHIDELIPWIDAHFRTIATRGERGVAGLSMGGFGAFTYAARHPDLFGTAASFSGDLDTNDPPAVGEPDAALSDGALPLAAWGPYQLDQILWRAHDPWDLAENLRGLNLIIRTGNGLPGGPFPYNAAGGAAEAIVHEEATDMHNRLDALGIPSTFQDYGPGDHSWPYWQRDLTLSLPEFMASFADPPPAPAAVTFTAAEPAYEAYGWNVVIARRAMEFSTLENATPGGFSLAGSGAGTVKTPAVYQPGATYPVAIGGTTHGVTADSEGRLTISVPLGPANPLPEYAVPATTCVYTTAVSIAPAAGSPPPASRPPACISVTLRVSLRTSAAVLLPPSAVGV